MDLGRFKSLLHMVSFIGFLTVKKKGTTPCSNLKKEVTIFQVIINKNANRKVESLNIPLRETTKTENNVP